MTLRNAHRKLGRAIAAGATLLVAQSAAVAQNNGLVQGVIYDAHGQPVAGAMVKLKHELRRLTFMVISREQGRFEAKGLPPGQYSLQAIGGDARSPWFDAVYVNASGSANTKVSLALTTIAAPICRRPGRNAFRKRKRARSPPIQRPAEGEGKALVAESCASCHDLRRVVVKRSNADHWHTRRHECARVWTIATFRPDDAEYDTIVNYLTRVVVCAQWSALERLTTTRRKSWQLAHFSATRALPSPSGRSLDRRRPRALALPERVAAGRRQIGAAMVVEREADLGVALPLALT